MNYQTKERTQEGMNKPMNEWMNIPINKWTNERMNPLLS